MISNDETSASISTVEDPARKRQKCEDPASSEPGSKFAEFEDQDKAIEHLVKAVVGLEDSFAMGNKVAVAGLSISFAGSNGETQKLALPQAPFVKTSEEIGGNLQVSPDLAQLLAVSTPSPFGEGNQTRTDPKVRRACHVPADRILSIDGLPLERILAEIREQLFPWEESPIEASLLKLNIYQEGDFFVEHRDTPLSDRSLGSLVITLPCAHFGGQLVVSHRGVKKVFDFAADMGSEENIEMKPVVSFAAFYGDALHSVQIVEKGIRLTLSYQLLRPVVKEPEQQSAMSRMWKQPAPKKSLSRAFLEPSRIAATAQRLVESFKEALMSSTFFPLGGRLAFPCFHLYETEEELPKDSDLNETVRAQAIGLRGADALVAVTAARLGLRVQVCRLALCDCTEKGTAVMSTQRKLITLKMAHTLGKVEIVQCDGVGIAINMDAFDGLAGMNMTWAVGIPGFVKGTVNALEIPKAAMLEGYIEGTGRYGNEAARGTIYSQCAIVIDVPLAGGADRQRCLERCSQGLPAEALRNTAKRDKSPAVEEKEAYQRWRNWSRTRVETRDVRRLQEFARQFHIRNPSSNAETLLEQIEAYVVRHPTMGSGDDYNSYGSYGSDGDDMPYGYNRYW